MCDVLLQACHRLLLDFVLAKAETRSVSLPFPKLIGQLGNYCQVEVIQILGNSYIDHIQIER
uniref:Uncharacterized protein n=1 Tax=Arion vulgaris TaxID=1028688 RepID=A0A0B7AXF5_9EUPU